MADEKRTSKSESELGFPGLVQYSGQVQEQWIDALKTPAKRIKVWDEMYRLDPTISAMIAATSMFMCGTDIQVESASKDKADIEAAEFLESCFHDMTKDWPDTMQSIILFLVYGFFDMELVYWVRDGTKSAFDDRRIGWRKWAPRHPVTLESWDFDTEGGLLAMHQLDPTGSRTAVIPIEKLLHFTTTGMGKSNPEGSSVLERAYTSWFYAKNLTIQEAITIERLGGTPVMKLPEGADVSDGSTSDATRAKRVVRNIKTAENMGLVLPYGFEFDFAMPQRGPALDPGEVILRHRRDMARTLMMDFLLLGGGDQGSWAMHKDKSALYIRAIGAFLKKISGTINRHGVPRLFSLNSFPETTGLPKCYFTPVTKIDIGGFAEVIAQLFESGATTYDLNTENMVRRNVGLPEIDVPGLTFKEPREMAAPEIAPEPEPDDDGEFPDEEEPEEELPPEEEPEEGEMAEFQESVPHGKAVKIVNEIGDNLAQDYDTWAEQLAKQLARTDVDQREAVLDRSLRVLMYLMLRRIRTGLIEIWDMTTEGDASPEGMTALANELQFQAGYIQNSLSPAIKRRVMEECENLEKDGANEVAIVLALIGLLAVFRYRVSTYKGAAYKVWANYARPTVIFERLQEVARKANVRITRDWNTGLILGSDLMARYEGPDDLLTCPDCSAVIQAGWMRSASIPPIGTLACDGRCRHWIAYKFRGRIYR
jgi:hypothetical protein